MRYKHKKTGCVANVRDDKRMDADWVAMKTAARSGKAAAKNSTAAPKEAGTKEG